MDMNYKTGRYSVSYILFPSTQFIFAWASVLPSYLERQCEGLKVWDGKEDFPTLFSYPYFMSPIRENRGDEHH